MNFKNGDKVGILGREYEVVGFDTDAARVTFKDISKPEPAYFVGYDINDVSSSVLKMRKDARLTIQRGLDDDSVELPVEKWLALGKLSFLPEPSARLLFGAAFCQMCGGLLAAGVMSRTECSRCDKLYERTL